jgi:hypothetical protein
MRCDKKPQRHTQQGNKASGPITQKTYLSVPANESSLNDEIPALGAWKGLKGGQHQACEELPGWKLLKKNNCGTHLEVQACTFSRDFGWRDQVQTIWKGNGKFKQCKNILSKDDFWRDSHFLQSRNLCTSIKNFKDKICPCKNSLEISFKSGSKRPRFTGIKNSLL